ncbi:MAG: hypothetical protein H0T46_18680 [Deltaproteobacteria bacterium]|nr:hypothetical protein [Deltaproteobacteria bacterium]
MRLAAALVALAACHPPSRPETIATPAPGITMSFYRAGARSYTVVDDRRTVEVRGGMLLLDHIDPGAALPSLVIEPLGGSTLVVGQCDRDHETHTLAPDDALAKFGQWQERRRQRIADGDPDPDPDPAPDGTVDVVSPVVRCNASGAQGPQLVRILYVSSGLTYSAQHAVTMTGADRATIATRFAIASPSWGGRAEVVLFEGVPGGDKPALELARGSLALDGSTSVLGAPPRETPARVRRVYDGATRTGVGDASDPTWGRDSVQAVWVWLELEGATLSPGPTHAHLELPGETIRDIDVPSAGRQHTRTGTRLPLWIDDQLRGLRTRAVVGSDGASLTDRFMVSISSTAAEPREVWIEEKLRPAKRRTLKAGWPTKPLLGADTARTKVLVKPGGVERLGYSIEYVF